MFKEKAVGSNLKDFEIKINEEITKKYNVAKAKCLSIYEAMCFNSINPDVEKIESMIR